MSISGYFRTLFRLLRSKRFLYSNLVEVLIDSEALRSNLHSFQKLNPDLSVAPVLKSNAYGHGLVPVAKIISKESVPFICVDSFFEAMILRNENISTPILILGYTPFANIAASKLSTLSFSILSLDELKSVAAQEKFVWLMNIIWILPFSPETGILDHGPDSVTVPPRDLQRFWTD
jgi:hypothetical protein